VLSLGSRHEESCSTLDPEFRRLVTSFQINAQHEGVTANATLSNGVVVTWARVEARKLLAHRDRLKVDHRHVADQFHDLRLHQAHLFQVPLGTLEVKTRDKRAVSNYLRNVSHRLVLSQEVEL